MRWYFHLAVHPSVYQFLDFRSLEEFIPRAWLWSTQISNSFHPLFILLVHFVSRSLVVAVDFWHIRPRMNGLNGWSTRQLETGIQKGENVKMSFGGNAFGGFGQSNQQQQQQQPQPGTGFGSTAFGGTTSGTGRFTHHVTPICFLIDFLSFFSFFSLCLVRCLCVSLGGRGVDLNPVGESNEIKHPRKILTSNGNLKTYSGGKHWVQFSFWRRLPNHLGFGSTPSPFSGGGNTPGGNLFGTSSNSTFGSGGGMCLTWPSSFSTWCPCHNDGERYVFDILLGIDTSQLPLLYISEVSHCVLPAIVDSIFQPFSRWLVLFAFPFLSPFLFFFFPTLFHFSFSPSLLLHIASVLFSGSYYLLS